MSNLTARLLTAAALIPLLVIAINWSNPLAVWAIVFTATFIGLREFYRMTMPAQARAERAFAIALGLGFGGALYWLDLSGAAVAVLLAAITIAALVFYLFAHLSMELVAGRVALVLSGVLYVALLLTFVALLKKRPVDGAAWVNIVLTVPWFGDTAAYFAGRFVSPLWPAKLYPAVSPNKTVIGGLGGLLGSFGAMALAKIWYLPTLTWSDCVLVGPIAGALGQLGDLCESMLKRSVGVKDSGQLLPGHGGMLDRIDGLLFSAPYIFCYARWLYGHL